MYIYICINCYVRDVYLHIRFSLKRKTNMHDIYSRCYTDELSLIVVWNHLHCSTHKVPIVASVENSHIVHEACSILASPSHPGPTNTDNTQEYWSQWSGKYPNWNWNLIHLWVTCWQLRKKWVNHYSRPVSTLYAWHTPGAAGNPMAVSFSRPRSQRSNCLFQIISLVVNVGIDLSGSGTHPIDDMHFRKISTPNIEKGIICVHKEILLLMVRSSYQVNLLEDREQRNHLTHIGVFLFP